MVCGLTKFILNFTVKVEVDSLSKKKVQRVREISIEEALKSKLLFYYFLSETYQYG
jgi:hypothetical protein